MHVDALWSRYLSAGPWAFAGELYLSMDAGASCIGASLFLGLVADPFKPAIRMPPKDGISGSTERNHGFTEASVLLQRSLL